jgi:putative glycosyltransferase
MFLSIVTTLYESEDTILDFYTRISAAAQVVAKNDYEIIFVNDGSSDLSLSLAKDLHNKDSKVSIVDLSKNFGHHRALMVGLEHSSGELVFLIDSDLEENPEELVSFYKKLKQDSSLDVVYGVQNERKGGFLERIFGLIFYKLFNFLSDSVTIPENSSTIRIMKRAYVESLLLFKDKEIYFTPLADMAGFHQEQHIIHKGYKKNTTYNFQKRYHLFINAIFSYTTKPLFFMFYTGCLITTVAMCYIFYLLAAYIFYGVAVSGWRSTIVSIWFFGGLSILFLGIISIYISKIYTETKNRPNHVVKKFWIGRDRASAKEGV